jgi:hypothetical protein
MPYLALPCTACQLIRSLHMSLGITHMARPTFVRGNCATIVDYILLHSNSSSAKSAQCEVVPHNSTDVHLSNLTTRPSCHHVHSSPHGPPNAGRANWGWPRTEAEFLARGRGRVPRPCISGRVRGFISAASGESEAALPISLILKCCYLEKYPSRHEALR